MLIPRRTRRVPVSDYRLCSQPAEMQDPTLFKVTEWRGLIGRTRRDKVNDKVMSEYLRVLLSSKLILVADHHVPVRSLVKTGDP